MEPIIKIFIYIHAIFGGLGLISGITSIIAQKGSVLHKKSGTLFSVGMLTSSIISLPIACMPNHENLFLFLIGLFTIYMVLVGNRAPSFKSKSKTAASSVDKILSGSMLLSSILMISYGIYGMIFTISNSILFLFFGGFGVFMTLTDFKFYKTFTQRKNSWLENHIGKMVGAFIASTTAFIVAGIGLDTIIAWVTPSIIGTIYIAYWTKKVKPSSAKKNKD